jgi:hypothetical protein
MVVLPGQHAFRSCGAPLAITEDTLTPGSHSGGADPPAQTDDERPRSVSEVTDLNRQWPAGPLSFGCPNHRCPDGRAHC